MEVCQKITPHVICVEFYISRYNSSFSKKLILHLKNFERYDKYCLYVISHFHVFLFSSLEFNFNFLLKYIKIQLSKINLYFKVWTYNMLKDWIFLKVLYQHHKIKLLRLYLRQYDWNPDKNIQKRKLNRIAFSRSGFCVNIGLRYLYCNFAFSLENISVVVVWINEIQKARKVNVWVESLSHILYC